ncbi:restriction endonuclease subunit S [Providencia sp. PROV152]|uniref:Restriction endonuclease subunit S n=3 Tax=Providencia stuartii TaxID=588 RepID=A0AAI9MY31_PROST|nr:restriction endonuclease subunit S [Providencia sp. PROV152]ELR5037719.1 restriction endonuclease subunit S [Providencia stuartii]
MSEWQNVTLKQLVKFGNGKSRPKEKGKIPVYGGNGILDFTDKYNYAGETLIIGRVGAYCGATYLEKSPVWVSDNALSAKALDNNNPDYLYYLFKYLDLNQYAQGSSHPLLTQTLLNAIEVETTLDGIEQKAIASVLSSLDDKINLLHRQNKTLEAMVETLFRQWFVEEANNVWPLVPLSSYIKCINGVSYKSSELKDSSTALVTLKNFSRDGGLRADGFKEFVGNYKESQLVIDKDIVVAHTDLTQDASLIGNPIYVQNIHNYTNLVISMDLVKVELISDSLTKEFLFYLLKSSDFKEHALSCSNGSSVIHLSKKALPSFIFKLPPNILVTKFTDIVQLLNHKGSDNQKQIQTLEKLRDTLLPKLMSGEVRVKYTPEAEQ